MRGLGVNLIAALIAVLPVVGTQAASVVVRTAPVAELEVPQIFRAPAEVIASNRTALASEVSARIQAINVDVGATVRAGEELVRLDAKDFELAVRRIEADLAMQDAQIEQAKIRLERAQSLAGDSYISADDLLARETDLRVLEAGRAAVIARLETARHEVSKSRIVAPFDGVVAERMAQLGAYVNPGAVLLTLVQRDNAQVEAAIPADQADTLRSSPARFITPAGAFPVKVLHVLDIIDPARRTRTARLAFTDQAAPVGASGQLEWSARSGLLPAHVIVRRDGNYGVFVVREGKASLHLLDTREEGRPARHELPADTLIITDGRQRVADGDDVELAP